MSEGRPDVGSLMATVRALELVARKNVSSLLHGNYLTTIPGRGIEFREARRYVQGEPVRQIDWKITARLDEPHVKTFLEERERSIWIALDVSPSMATGWQARSKLQTAIEVAATLAVSAGISGDRVGCLLFADAVHRIEPPRRGRAALHRILSTLATALDEVPSECRESDPRAAIHAIQAQRGRRFVVFLLSDFIDHDVPDDLRFVRHRHDVSLVHVYDPFEYAVAPPEVRLVARAAEGEARTHPFRPGDTGTLPAMRDFLARAAARHRIALVSISVLDPVGPVLAGFFHRRRRAMG